MLSVFYGCLTEANRRGYPHRPCSQRSMRQQEGNESKVERHVFQQ